MTQFGITTESSLVAITADVVASRHSTDRRGLQESLVAAARAVSRDRRAELAADIEVTAGDEVQALLLTPVAVVPVLQQLSDAIQPDQFAFGVGVGPLSTTLPDTRSARRPALLDGPCFHHARAALEAAQKRGAWAAVEGFEPLDEPLTAMLELLGRFRQSWTDKQATYVAATRDAAQKDVAARYEVSPSVISESLKAADFDVVRRGEAGAIALFSHYVELTSGRLGQREPGADPGPGA